MNKELKITKNERVMIYLCKQEDTAVKISAGQLVSDIKNVTGGFCETSNELSKNVDTDLLIVAGTIGRNKEIDKKIQQGKLNVRTITDETGAFRWEGFVIQEGDGVLYIAGSDSRGTVYGIYEFSRWIGVSPWHYFGDVPIKKKELLIPYGFYKSDYPSVKYRGIFINDEEELEAWAKKHTKDKTIGPELYEKIFELLLRLKANYIWPAMHVNYFNENPKNGELANEMGIVVGTSHCDMLLRSNQNEWKPWIEKKGYHTLKYDYSIEGDNREKIKEYWREGLEQNRDYENTYTIGMRGIHDSGFVTSRIDDTELTKEQVMRKKVELMEKIFCEQRAILKQVLGKEKAQKAEQIFVPYKEVLELYDAGLHVPDDVTILWVNDNFGHMRRYPDAKELSRKGGHGLYFHNSYWAHPEMSYLFINSIPLAQTGNELEKSYQKGIRKLWVLNVGAIKPLEMDIEYFIQYGWEAGKDEAVTRNQNQFVKEWIDSNFSGGIGETAAELYRKYAQLTNVRKVEHLVSDAFVQEGYGDEAGRRLRGLKEVYDRGNKLWATLPENERDAFFELFLMKIHASFFCNAEYYYADRSRLSYQRGIGRAADKYISYSREMMDCRRQMLFYYNFSMSNGKWSDILTPESFPPPGIPLYPAGKPALSISGGPHMSVVTWDGEQIGSEGELTFYGYGIKTKWIEIGNTGNGELQYEIKGSENTWLSVSDTKGTIQTEKRIYLSVEDTSNHVTDEILLELYCKNTGEKKTLHIKQKFCHLPVENFDGAVEADGGIIIPATDYTRAENIKPVPCMGRMGGDSIMAFPQKGRNAIVEYPFYTFSEGTFEVEIWRYVTLNSRGRIRLEIKIDEAPAVSIESNITDEWRGNWKDSILNNGEKLSFPYHIQKSGMHTITITIPDEFVTIDRIIIYTEPKKKNNLGIPHTGIDGYGMTCQEDTPNIDIDEIKRQTARFYKMEQSDALLPNQVYAGADFWKIDRLYALNEEYRQTKRGKERNYYLEDGTAKDVLGKIAKTKLQETDGKLGIEAECVLAENKTAWRTFDKKGMLRWEHLQSETAGRTGLAMQIEAAGIIYDNPCDAPGLNYRINIQNQGLYHVWILVYIPDDRSDLFVLETDGCITPLRGQFTYGTSHIYYWDLVSDISFTKGEHVFSILPVKTGFRVDRIYLTQGDELPPNDYEWDNFLL